MHIGTPVDFGPLHALLVLAGRRHAPEIAAPVLGKGLAVVFAASLRTESHAAGLLLVRILAMPAWSVKMIMLACDC